MPLYPDQVRAHDAAAPSRDRTETLTFGLGCFWGPDAQFGAMDGVVHTRVGYAGGSKPDPTYHALGDHTEVLQVDYDPAELSIADLLTVIFNSHDPQKRVAKRQYQHVVFHDSRAQREAILHFLDARGRSPDGIETRFEELQNFTVAEDYHQKYNLRSRRWILDAFEDAGYDDADIRESPAAAKLNAVAAGKDISDHHQLGTDTRPQR